MISARRTVSTVSRLVVMLAVMLPAFAATPAPIAVAAPATCGAGCAVTIDARDLPTGSPLASFSFIVNLDNTKLPTDPLALNSESNSPVVAVGGDSDPTAILPDGRYLVSVRSLDHKMWGAHFTLPDDAADDGTLTVRVDLSVQSGDNPLPLGKIRVFVFRDNSWTNGAPDTEEAGLGGFQVGLEEQTGNAVTVDYNNDPLCGGICQTSSAPATLGFAEITNLGPATYFIDVHPPDSCDPNDPTATSGPGQWYQTTTIDGGFSLMAPTEEGADGTGAPGEQLWEPPNIRTAYWFGFVCSPTPFANPGTGEIVGQARNWVEWAPYTVGTYGDPVENPFVALSDASTDVTVYIGQGDAAGNFDIQNVPSGDYNLAIWDEQLSYIMRFKPVHVDAGATVDVNDVGDDGSIGVGVSRWFGWLDGTVYKDLNGNGQYDAGVDEPIANTDMDQRWRDGSIKEATFTDSTGYYVYPTAEGGALGRWIINEQGFARFTADPGASVHDEFTGVVTPSCLVDGVPVSPCIPNSQGGGLLMNQKLLEGHRATVDWGKRDYPEGTPGQIVGVTYFPTTRNEFNPALQAHEDYEPGIPDVTVYLETLGADGLPNTTDDVIVNEYVTDHWQQPNASQDPQDPPGNTFTQNCDPIRDFSGAPITGLFNPIIGPNCLEVPLAGQQTKDGAFDGGYAFTDYCEDGYDTELHACVGGVEPVPLVTGDYIVHAIMPTDPNDDQTCNPPNDGSGFKNLSGPFGDEAGAQTGCLYRIVREEDVNVDLGNQFAPQIPPPPCVGDDHVLDQSTLVTRSPYYGDPTAHAPLCDKKLVVLQNAQNANADFNMMTNFRTDPNGDGTSSATGDVVVPGRVVGQVFNDIYFERNPMSNWYGEPRPIGGIPVGIYARVDTVPNVNQPFDPNTWRLIKTLTTSADGSYEILLPSTETFNCPIPQGPCPGMYIAIVDDPGTIEHQNAGYDPNLLTANTPFDVWPGLTTQLDTPVDPISGTACEDPAAETGPARPELLQVSRPYVLPSDSGSGRRITIFADFISQAPDGTANTAAGTVRLTDWSTRTSMDLTTGNGGIVSWAPGSGSTPDTIVIQVPALGPNFPPGPKQLSIITAGTNGAVPSVNGITLHVLNDAANVNVSHTDNANTFDGRFVFDTSIVAADAGRAVTATGVPAGTTISTVSTSGPSSTHFFTMSNAATLTGFRMFTITKTDTGVSITAGSNTAGDPSIVAGDLGRIVTISGSGGVTNRTITSVNTTALTFTFSGAASTATGTGRTAAIRKTDNAFTNTGTFVLDTLATAADVGSAVTGPGIPAGTTVTSAPTTFAGIGSGFTMNNAAVATSYPGTVGLTLSTSLTFPIYNPPIVNVAPPPPGGAGSIQAAIDGATPGSLIVLSPGTYNENVLAWKPVKLQGLGPGGIIGAHEFGARDPEDARFAIPGTVIDGRFFQQNADAFDAAVAAHAPYVLPPFTSGSPSVVLRGADVTVVAQTPSAYDIPAGATGIFSAARIDGLGLMTGRGDGAGGIQLQASINNMQLTNNVLENNGGVFAGGIAVGQPFVHGSHNYGVRMDRNRLIGNGGLASSGGVAIFYGSDGYDLANSVVCSNFSVVYGAGVSHIGLSPNGSIHDNQIYYNESVDSGAGIAIGSELPVGGGLGDGSGAVNVDRNLIQSNTSVLDDGGGIFVLNALDQRINIRNNMIVNNVAADLGGAIMLDDSSRVAIINNTIANNVTTASSENSDIGVPHGAGLTSEANESTWQTDSRYTTQYPNASTRPYFSNPVALFNNLFWQNNAMTLSQFGPGATLVDNGFIDFEVFGTCLPGRTGNCANDTFTPRYSDLTNGLILRANGALNAVPGGQANIIGADPLFVTPFELELTVSGSRLDPQQAAVSITGQDPPVGLTGDYHIQTGSPAINNGAGFSNLAVPAPAGQLPSSTSSILAPCSGTTAQAYPADFDLQWRPRGPASNRTPWDLGADEIQSSTQVVIPKTSGTPQFQWNGTGQLQCSTSTVLATP